MALSETEGETEKDENKMLGISKVGSRDVFLTVMVLPEYVGELGFTPRNHCHVIKHIFLLKHKQVYPES